MHYLDLRARQLLGSVLRKFCDNWLVRARIEVHFDKCGLGMARRLIYLVWLRSFPTNDHHVCPVILTTLPNPEQMVAVEDYPMALSVLLLQVRCRFFPEEV
jgi:hypothetical protein